MGTTRQWVAAMMAMGRGAEVGCHGLEERRQDSEMPDDRWTRGGLSPQQREAVARGVDVVERYGGVLLADAVGLGKTRVSLAMARQIVARTRRRAGEVEPPLFAIPARLHSDWRRAINEVGWQIGRDAHLVSHHRLSRRPWSGRPALVVVDEAHRFRNPKAKRSVNLAKITSRSPPILLTATPVCTKRTDLEQLLRYFLGDSAIKTLVGMDLKGAFEADAAGEFDIVEILEQVVIRRKNADFGQFGRPDINFELLRYRASDEERWLWKNLEPRLRGLTLAATGKYWPRGLLINNLLRLWESGPEALGRSLDELIHFHERWLAAAESGRSVERPEFQVLFDGVDRRQQVFDFLFGSEKAPNEDRRQDVARDYATLVELAGSVALLRRDSSAMVESICELVEKRQDQRFLIFAAYLGSAESIYSALAQRRRGLRVGLVTGDEARATGLGRSCDRGIIGRFTNTDQKFRRHQQLRILVTTDCLAEGLNLQGCSHLILADLPYTPVKLEQRIGRVARPGSSVRRVTVYLPRPESWTDSLGMRRRLGERLKMAKQFGAGLRLAGAIDGGDDEKADKAPGPLAAMTLEERLWRRLESEQSRETPPDFARVGDPRDPDLWIRVIVDGVVRRYLWVYFPKGSAEPTVRLGDQLRGLAMLVDDDRKLSPWQPRGKLWKEALRWMESRRNVLEAARLAPPLLGLDSEPVRIWRRVRRAAGSRARQWRQRLLRTHPPGIRAEMAELIDGDHGTARLVRFVKNLPDVAAVDSVEIRCVGALLIQSASAPLRDDRRHGVPAGGFASSYSRT